MTIGEKMTITTWKQRQLAYLEEMYAPEDRMNRLKSHPGMCHIYIQLYTQMHAALESLPDQPVVPDCMLLSNISTASALR